jgi:hypothetical protein
MITEDPQLETRLRHYGSVLRDEVRVSPNLHAQIIAQIDGGRAPVHSHRFMVQLSAAAAIVLVALGAMGLVLKLRANELAKSAPQVTSVSPADGAKDVPLKGEFRVEFASRPANAPTLRAEPAEATLQPVEWAGATMVVKYAGLHPSAHYELILSADYRSHLGDKGHFEKRWGFTAEGPAQIASTTPAAGETGAARNGQLSIRFVRRPAVDPVVHLDPPDGSMEVGKWTDTTWAVNYSGLQALRAYRASLDLDFGNAAANFHHEWSFTAEPGAPPKNIPLIWYGTSTRPSTDQDSNRPYRMLALDWNGALVGSLYTTGSAYQAPDGTRLFIGTGYADQAGTVLAPALSLKGGPGFADDSRHVCAMGTADGSIPSGNGEPGWLFTGQLGSVLHRVVQFGTYGGQSAPRLVACSYQNDRAVVEQDGPMSANEVRVFILSTGALLYQHQYTSGQVASWMLASHDGRYLAEQTISPDAQGRQVFGDTLIRRTSDGTVVARLAAQSVVAFSWDGSRVVTTPALNSVDSHEVHLVDWQRGQVLWRLPEPAGIAPGSFAYVSTLARPGGTDFMIGVAASSSGQSPVDQLWLVHANGTAVQVAKGPIFPGF